MPKLGTHSRGKIREGDEGDFAVAIFLDHKNNVVVIDFGTEVTWLGLDARTARQFANTLLREADVLEGK
jgi:hypothetical protein